MQFEEQIKRVRTGDQQALDDLLSHWRQILRDRSSGKLGRDIAARADTSDVAQEAIIQTWRNLPQFRGDKEDQFFAWTRTIGDGQASKQRRNHLRHKRSVHREIPDSVERPSNDHAPEIQAASQEELALVLKAVEQLDHEKQFVILRRFVDDTSLGDIADELGSSYSVVRGLYGRALKELRVALQTLGIERQVGS